jgi:regulator of sirC expression with transglutaminase-like and TPR domain
MRIRYSTPHGQARALGELLDGELGLTADDSRQIAGAMLGRALATRRARPVLLAAIWIEVARRAGALADGIGLPGRLLVRIGGPNGALVDPGAGGRIVDEAECQRIVHRASEGRQSYRAQDFPPASVVGLLNRVLQFLLAAHAASKDALAVYRDLSFFCALRPELPAAQLQRAALAEQLGAQRFADEIYRGLARQFPGSAESQAAQLRLLELQQRGPMLLQ